MDPLSICFGLCSIMGFLSVYRVWKDKHIAGVSVLPSFVYMATQVFETLFFLQHGQPCAAIGALLMLSANAAWLILVYRYRWRSQRLKRWAL